MKITNALKAAAKAFFSEEDPQSFHAGGKSIQCPHCRNVLFYIRKASLNTSFSTLTNTEWMDSEAAVLICANCSRMEWFLDEPEIDANQ